MFRVRWERTVLNDVAEAWVNADSELRAAITAATNEVDQRLSRDPDNEGESRSEGRRIFFVPPLAVTFRVEADGQTVSVLQVCVFRTPA